MRKQCAPEVVMQQIHSEGRRRKEENPKRQGKPQRQSPGALGLCSRRWDSDSGNKAVCECETPTFRKWPTNGSVLGNNSGPEVRFWEVRSFFPAYLHLLFTRQARKHSVVGSSYLFPFPASRFCTVVGSICSQVGPRF